MILLDPVQEPVVHRLLRLTGTVRQWTCSAPHRLQVASLTFPVRRHRFIAWLQLADGDNELQLQLQCDRCRLACCRQLTVRCRPLLGPRHLQPALLVCAGEDGSVEAPPDEDGSAAAAAERILVGARLLQTLLADKLAEHYPARPARTLSLCETVVTVRLQLTRRKAQLMSPEQLWRAVAAELRDSDIDLDNTKVLAFLACAESLLPTASLGGGAGGVVWRGGGGLALCPAACLYAWPRSVAEIVARFTDGREVPPDCLDQSSGRGRRWAVLSTTLGAAAHELGHILDLGHAEHGLMARAYDDVWRYCVLPDGSGDGDTAGGQAAGHRCGFGCHGRAVTVRPAPDDGTFLDAASAAVLYHHAWCVPCDGGHPAPAVTISDRLRVRCQRPLRVALCTAGDGEARMLAYQEFTGTDTEIDLLPWLVEVVKTWRSLVINRHDFEFQPQQPNKSGQRDHPVEDREVVKDGQDEEEEDVKANTFGDGAVLCCSDGDQRLPKKGADHPAQAFTVLVESEGCGTAKRTLRL